MKNIIIVVFLTAWLSSCGGDSENDNVITSSNFALSGTVPGTLIEAFGDNGSYYSTNSTSDGTSTQHPFTLSLKSGVKYTLFATVNEDSADSITTPIFFQTDNNTPTAIFTASTGASIDLSFLDIPTTRSATIDGDNDGIMDDGKYYTLTFTSIPDISLREQVGTYTWDIDGDGRHNKYDDDVDGDGTSNSDDGDYSSTFANDSDYDGIKDNIDINPDNISNSNSFSSAYYDLNNDGYFDADENYDGRLDDDRDSDGDGEYEENEANEYYGSRSLTEIKGRVESKDVNTIVITVYKSEYTYVARGTEITIDTTNAYFEHTNFNSIAVGNYIEAKGALTGSTLTAQKIEREY